MLTITELSPVPLVIRALDTNAGEAIARWYERVAPGAQLAKVLQECLEKCVAHLEETSEVLPAVHTEQSLSSVWAKWK